MAFRTLITSIADTNLAVQIGGGERNQRPLLMELGALDLGFHNTGSRVTACKTLRGNLGA